MSKVGILILAGGKGTRLGCEGPKGCVRLPSYGNQTLFEILLKKVEALNLPVAIMTSSFTHEATLTYLEKENYFGLTNVKLFSQGVSDGNGRALSLLYASGILEEVSFIQVLPIDNPLAKPFDPELLATHEKEGVELVLRAVKRTSYEEKLGVIGEKEGRLTILEYTEKPPGILKNPLGNTGLFSCTMDFVKRTANIPLPEHPVQKQEGGRWIFKKETFIFDLFPHANSFKLITSDRKKCFAPIKTPDAL
ncbi:UTP--glucose-1-phosphate uridylyltransferase [Candidatus Neptunochlamydia vexilliferae]|uniref:MobA-like NTP transferase domain-containing protein n=1 Tax=Candidatus Neptunichlamydia vexilliferae TaxID=1651774 RepID=A0ABS0AXR2_9BACT|nr:UTP--glucose-1-phosphate uridylyltransferase [Candidatus Neptunochlamydia vexilliferae]MBF5058749.1 hypothetical protein [Candidatus Neptunochlamydia vexilliferae]